MSTYITIESMDGTLTAMQHLRGIAASEGSPSGSSVAKFVDYAAGLVTAIEGTEQPGVTEGSLNSDHKIAAKVAAYCEESQADAKMAAARWLVIEMAEYVERSGVLVGEYRWMDYVHDGGDEVPAAAAAWAPGLLPVGESALFKQLRFLVDKAKRTAEAGKGSKASLRGWIRYGEEAAEIMTTLGLDNAAARQFCYENGGIANPPGPGQTKKYLAKIAERLHPEARQWIAGGMIEDPPPTRGLSQESPPITPTQYGPSTPKTSTNAKASAPAGDGARQEHADPHEDEEDDEDEDGDGVNPAETAAGQEWQARFPSDDEARDNIFSGVSPGVKAIRSREYSSRLLGILRATGLTCITIETREDPTCLKGVFRLVVQGINFEEGGIREHIDAAISNASVKLEKDDLDMLWGFVTTPIIATNGGRTWRALLVHESLIPTLQGRFNEIEQASGVHFKGAISSMRASWRASVTGNITSIKFELLAQQGGKFAGYIVDCDAACVQLGPTYEAKSAGLALAIARELVQRGLATSISQAQVQVRRKLEKSAEGRDVWIYTLWLPPFKAQEQSRFYALIAELQSRLDFGSDQALKPRFLSGDYQHAAVAARVEEDLSRSGKEEIPAIVLADGFACFLEGVNASFDDNLSEVRRVLIATCAVAEVMRADKAKALAGLGAEGQPTFTEVYAAYGEDVVNAKVADMKLALTIPYYEYHTAGQNGTRRIKVWAKDEETRSRHMSAFLRYAQAWATSWKDVDVYPVKPQFRASLAKTDQGGHAATSQAPGQEIAKMGSEASNVLKEFIQEQQRKMSAAEQAIATQAKAIEELKQQAAEMKTETAKSHTDITSMLAVLIARTAGLGEDTSKPGSQAPS